MMTDDWETPKDEWEFITKSIPTTTVLYDPFVCNGRSKIYLEDLGYKVEVGPTCPKETRTETSCDCIDKFYKDISTFDMILTNPPFSMLEKVIPKLLSYNKPMCLLMPEAILGS